MSMDGLRVTVRTLRKQLGFSTVVVLSLALAISLNTTMYSVLDALVHPRVDIRDPDRVFQVRFFGDYKYKVSPAARDSLMRLGAPSIEGVAAHNPVGGYRPTVITAGRVVLEVPTSAVNVDYMALMGPKLIAGRWFNSADANASTRPIMLEERVAAKLFGEHTDPIGQTVAIKDTTFAVVGVVSRYAAFPEDVSRAWTLPLASGQPVTRMSSWLVRVRPGVTRAVLERDLMKVTERISALSGEPAKDDAFRVKGATVEQLVLRALDRALIIAVLSVLLVACANLANMQIARGITRGRELALRTALGATRARIIRHLLAESVVLAAVGLVLGLVLTLWGMHILRASIPPSVGTYIVEPQWSWRVLAFALIATVACIVLVGVAPSIKVSRVDPNEMLKQGHGTGATRRHRRQYGYLVAGEMALALALFSAAVITVRGALYVDQWVGYDFKHMASGMLIAKPKDIAGKPLPEVLASLQQTTAGLPTVVTSAVEVGMPYEGGVVTIADSSGIRSLQVIGLSYHVVTPSWVRAHGLAIVAGRDFREGERDVGGVLIDEVTARKLWPNANPIGALIKLGDPRSKRAFVRVVGEYSMVDENGKPKPTDMVKLLEGTIGNVVYLPSMADSLQKGIGLLPASLVVRTSGDPAVVVPAMRSAGVIGAATLEDNLGLATARESRAFMAKVFTLFAALGVGLACFGVYGVVAHSVAERRRELGVRIALGATSRDILRAILRESVVIALSGVAIGLFLTKYGAVMVSQLSQGYDIYNAPMFAIVALALVGVAGASALGPAHRATQIDPTESLRSE